jgi:prolyl-tRNA editing enzyme YbaK/EbsC (Cys-tRNA(Pro) deacylase)
VHPTVERVTAALATLGADGAVRELTIAATTAALAAEALGVDVGAIANSLVFRSTEPVLILASGRHRVDTAKVAALLGLPSLERANPAYVRDATGQTIGGVAPVGHPTALRTVVDTALADYDVVWAAAGTAHTVFPTTYDELVRITGGMPAEVSSG